MRTVEIERGLTLMSELSLASKFDQLENAYAFVGKVRLLAHNPYLLLRKLLTCSSW